MASSNRREGGGEDSGWWRAIGKEDAWIIIMLKCGVDWIDVLYGTSVSVISSFIVLTIEIRDDVESRIIMNVEWTERCCDNLILGCTSRYDDCPEGAFLDGRIPVIDSNYFCVKIKEEEEEEEEEEEKTFSLWREKIYK